MNAAVSLPAFDWHTIEPADWPYLADLLPGHSSDDRNRRLTAASIENESPTGSPPPDRPSGVVLAKRPAPWSPKRPPEPHPRPPMPPTSDNGWLHAFTSSPVKARKHGSAPKWTDCGNPDCTLRNCAGVIAARDEKEHERAVRRTHFRYQAAVVPKPDDEKPPKSPYKRPSRAKSLLVQVAETPRVVRRLTDEQREYAQRVLATRPVRRMYQDADGGRREWISAAWVELENPHDDVEIPDDFDKRVIQAIWRGEWSLRPDERECTGEWSLRRKPAPGTPSI